MAVVLIAPLAAQVRDDLALLTRRPRETASQPVATQRSVPAELKTLALSVLKVYQVVLSPQDAPTCNFTVSCSRFAARAIEAHGLLHGSAIAADRILRCNGLSGRHYDVHPELLLAIDLPVDAYRLGRRRGPR